MKRLRTKNVTFRQLVRGVDEYNQVADLVLSRHTRDDLDKKPRKQISDLMRRLQCQNRQS